MSALTGANAVALNVSGGKMRYYNNIITTVIAITILFNLPKNGTTASQHSRNSAVGIRSFSRSTISSNFLGALKKNVSSILSLTLSSPFDEDILSPTRAGIGRVTVDSRGEAGGEEVGVTKKSELLRRCICSGAELSVGVISFNDSGRDWGAEPSFESCDSKRSRCWSKVLPFSCSVATPFSLPASRDDKVPVRCVGRDLVGCRSAKGAAEEEEVGGGRLCLWVSGEVTGWGGKGGLWTGVSLGG